MLRHGTNRSQFYILFRVEMYFIRWFVAPYQIPVLQSMQTSIDQSMKIAHGKLCAQK